MTYLAPYLSPLGPITLASDGESLTGLWFDGQKYDRASLHGAIAVDAPLPEVLVEACHWLDLYFAGEVPDFVPKLRVEGSPFRQSVAEVMLTIPYGGTMTYGEIGRLLAERMDAGGSDLSARLETLQAQADRLDAGLTGQAALVQALRAYADTLNAALQALTERVEALEQASSEP